MKSEQFLIKKFGDNEYGFADIPEKISNVIMSRFANIHDGNYYELYPYRKCYYSFLKFNKPKCWKQYRKQQWKLRK